MNILRKNMKKQYENSIRIILLTKIEMLYQCFVFLRQAGMWEQMWEILRLNLSLNLGLGKETFRLQRSIDEKKLSKLTASDTACFGASTKLILLHPDF